MQSIIPIAAGLTAIAVGIFYLAARSDTKTFRWLTLLGYIVVIVGLMNAGIVGAWSGLALFASWFGLAVYFIVKERKR